MVFYNRKYELTLLKKRYNSLKEGDMVIFYGRRRVGKTELVKEFVKNVSHKLYLYVDVATKQEILNSFSQAIKEQLGETIRFEDFKDFFDFISEKADNFVLIIDEFQRFLEISPDFITKLQNEWDSKLRRKKIFLILVGSSIGMIQKITNSKVGALYGRGTQIKISPFRYVDFREMFSTLNEEKKIEFYGVFGGTPYYLNKAKKSSKDIYSIINELIISKDGELASEPKILLEYENVRTHAKYNSILASISSGNELIKEIEDFTKIKLNTLPAYLTRLDTLLDLVEKKDPILGKGKLGRYGIRDNFFRFWYRYIFPNIVLINLGNEKRVEEIIKIELNSYLGKVFEDVVKELIILYQGKKIKDISIDFENIGKWWDRNGNEIDLVCSNSKTKRILIGEVKWKNKQVDVDVVDELIRKSKIIGFNGKYDFIIVSKSGFTSKCLTRMKEEHIIGLDLKNVENLFENV